MASKGSPEHIGHTLLAAEAAPKAERNPLKVPLESIVEKGSGNKLHPATMSRAELIAISETIFIDGSSLRQIYETHLIGERGLRRLVAEQLKGGDLHNALRLEVMEREMDFERDPNLRDVGRVEPEGSVAKVSELLDGAPSSTPDIADTEEKAAFYKAQAQYKELKVKQHSQRRQLFDLAVIAVISFLLLLIIILLMAR